MPEPIVQVGKRLTLKERFWAKVSKTRTCWLWTGTRTPLGYGRINIGKRRSDYAHRLSYLWTHGEIPEGVFVLHHCDNPSCVRPDHLFLGTHKDNMKDMREKNRSRKRGEENPQAKLTAEDVINIRRIYRLRRATQQQLATRYKVTQTTICNIINRILWPHL